jgi:hypothetical protein
MIRRAAASAVVLSAIALASIPLSAAPPPQQDGGPFIQDEPRAMARVAYFNQSGLQGEYLIEYGKPAWKAEYDDAKKWGELTRGKRLRLGRDWWTSLNTFCPLTLSEKVELKPGEYFLALECSDKGEWSLVAMDPEPLRKSRFDAFGTEQTKGGTKAALRHEETKESAAQLAIRFIQDEKDKRLQTLEIRFGRHRLTTSVQPKL